MTVANGAEPGGNQQSTKDDHDAGPGSDDVVIMISGPTAARMLARGDTEARAQEGSVRELRQRLDGIEAAAAQRATDHQRLGQLMQGLLGQIAQLGGQMGQLKDQVSEQATQLPAELGRLREEVGDQSNKLRHLQGKIDQLQQRIDSLGRDVARAPPPRPYTPPPGQPAANGQPATPSGGTGGTPAVGMQAVANRTRSSEGRGPGSIDGRLNGAADGGRLNGAADGTVLRRQHGAAAQDLLARLTNDRGAESAPDRNARAPDNEWDVIAKLSSRKKP